MTEQTPIDAQALIQEMGRRARAASAVLALAPTAPMPPALVAAPKALRPAESALLAANGEDMARGEANGLTGAMLDRLKLTPQRIEGIAAGLEAVAKLPD